MLRAWSLLVACLLFATAVACDGNDGAGRVSGSPSPDNASTIVPVTPAPKPSNVPESAQELKSTTELGSITRRANQPPETSDIRDLRDANCEGDVITLETQEETIYAALSCENFWDEDYRMQFVGHEVAITLEVTDVRFRVLVETVEGAQAEFTVAGTWTQ